MKEVKQKLQAAAPGIFEGTPVLFAYLYGSYAKALSHPFSDMDIGIYVEDIERFESFDLSIGIMYSDRALFQAFEQYRLF